MMKCFALCLCLVTLVCSDYVSGQSDIIEQLNEARIEDGTPLFGNASGQGSARIYGGIDVGPGEVPWMVSIFYNDKFRCGGAVYDRLTILTLADCVSMDDKQTDGNFVIKAGDIRLEQFDNGQQERDVMEIYIHPKYQKRAFGYNIAILKLRKRLRLNEFVQRVRIPEPWKEELVLRRDQCVYTGWGMASFPGGSISNNLKLVGAVIYPGTTWVNLKQHLQPYKGLHISTYFPGSGGCYGDFGAPLVCYDQSGDPYQVGILELIPGSCFEGFGIHARLTKVKDWIESYDRQD